MRFSRLVDKVNIYERPFLLTNITSEQDKPQHILDHEMSQVELPLCLVRHAQQSLIVLNCLIYIVGVFCGARTRVSYAFNDGPNY